MDGQPLGGARAWSFDDTLQRQRYLNMRPGLLNRHSLDAGEHSPHQVCVTSFSALARRT